ncbi:MAG TPA: type II toxin-antitoxin system Phd/YefM family antitoxin [Gammaproteobacteria bacterium]|nr:type II toxin-antitoxin system Phd/YefM family antitoxin [Gammaproteobacteria bacterium]
MSISPEHTIAAGEFKAKCLKVIDKVHDSGEPFVITKHGVPFAKLIPYSEDNYSRKQYYGCLSDTISVQGDIIAPIDEPWNAESNEE